jgi:hypothetical protein
MKKEIQKKENQAKSANSSFSSSPMDIVVHILPLNMEISSSTGCFGTFLTTQCQIMWKFRDKMS